jgi:uncharacterized membrane protein YgcG
MERRRSLVLVSLLAIATAACTASAGTVEQGDPPDAAAGPNDVLVLGTSDGPMLVDVASGEPIGDGAATLAAPDGSRLYTTSSDGGTTSLVTRDAATGEIVAETEVDGRFDVRVASVSGDAVAMMEPLPDGVDPWTPIPRATTTLVVADPTGAEPARRLTLDGNFEPEAFSADDRNVFLIEHLPAEDPTAYRVTSLDLETEEIRPVAGRFKVPPQRMPGTRLLQLFDPIRAQLYTLYTNEARSVDDAWDTGGSYGDGGSYGGGSYGGDGSYGDAEVDVTFVHVLNLRSGWAFCAGVPRSFWGRPPRDLALATSPDGALLYLVDAASGIVSEMDTRSLEIVRTQHVDLGDGEGARTSAAVSLDGRTIVVGSVADGRAVRAFSTETYVPLARWATPSTVHDLRFAPGGDGLYAALDDAIAVLDPRDGTIVRHVPIGGVDRIVQVLAAA